MDGKEEVEYDTRAISVLLKFIKFGIIGIVVISVIWFVSRTLGWLNFIDWGIIFLLYIAIFFIGLSLIPSYTEKKKGKNNPKKEKKKTL